MRDDENRTGAVPDGEKIKLANAIKDEANALFQAKKYEESIEKYTKAIDLNPGVAAYYANRAFAHIKTEAYGYAAADANMAIELDPNYIKGYYRRASANMATGKFKEALRDFRIVVKRAPNDTSAKMKLTECEKIVRRIEFEKAIEFDDSVPSIADQLDVDSIVVEESYDGKQLKDGAIDLEFVDDMIERFKNQKKIHKKFAYHIIITIRKILLETPPLVEFSVPEGSVLTVCGDVHGQFYDFLNIFDINGRPSPTNMYLFNGDFVDRGSFSVEIALTLFAYKCLYPESVFIARGNHESDDMNKVYGFEGEVKAKFSDTMYKLFTQTFTCLPLAHLISDKIFVVHGGLFSKDGVTLDDIRKIDRFKVKRPADHELVSDMLWSDPHPSPGRALSKRGVGVQFGPDVTEKFLKDNDLDLIIRSHEVKEEGYVIEHNGKCITVFSAPNYCDSVGNKGALIRIDSKLKLEFKTFAAVPHPNVRAMAYASPLGGLF
ncbi:uncharacterized protein VTP21DRAFT_8392 [Calcarisporiella thermophila]|uniref:uncharacterized protein n=1 Tax=Calcarisporiella thermophila TaxID=911321 RepID=UPI003743E7D1